MPDDSTGVTAGAPTAPGSGLDSGSADTGGPGASDPNAQGTDPGAPVAVEDVNGADAGVGGFGISEEELSQAPEQWRDKFKSLLSGYKSLESDHKPLKTWVDQRGGLQYVQPDIEAFDGLFSENIESRQQAYAHVYNQDAGAFERIITDFATDPMVQRRAIENISPQALLQYVQELGLLPEQYSSNIDETVLQAIPAELQQVFRQLPAEVRDEYMLMQPGVRNWNLRRDAQLQNIQYEQSRTANQQREQAQYEQKSKVYSDVRSIIQQSLAEKIPGNDQATQFVLQATETALYQSPEGAALWNELEAHIERGEARAVREKLPLLVTKAKAIATQQAVWLNERESKARQFDELMRLSNYDDIIRHVNQLRGGMKQPGQGVTPQPTNGHIPKPEMAGQYDTANVLSYFPGRS